MNQRENFYAMIRGEKPEFITATGMYNKMCLMPLDPESPQFFGGTDGFGVNWVVTPTGAIPEPGKYVLEDIKDWKKYVKFPDIDAVDYKAMAEQELAGYNRDELVLTVPGAVVGFFTRLVALMGFENALISLVCDPESCHEFGEAFAEFEIKRLNKIIDAYQPDLIWYGDDVAHARGLFMSPETYFNVIRPYTKKIIDAATSRNVIVGYHCCGKCEDIVGDFIELGCKIWSSAQIMNDIEGIQKKYGNRLIIEGGWDTMGRPGCIDATEKEICDEVVRCVNTYGKYGNFIIFPVMFTEKGNSLIIGDDPRVSAMIETLNRVGKL